MKPYTRLFLFLGIIILAVFLRFWQLGSVPVSPDWDEAALGYNAYSVLKTGRDEYGTFLPLSLRSFDDYKPPLYMYLSIVPVWLFGLSVWSVRLPSAVFGTIAVIATYFAVRKLSSESDEHKKRRDSTLLALLAAGLLAISPWHLQFSRIAFEANIGVTLNILGLLAFLYGLTSTSWLMASAFFFGMSLYAYHSERIFAPLFVLTLVILWRKELFLHPKRIAAALCVGILTVLPLIPVVLDKTSLTRLSGTSSLSDTTGLLKRTVQKLEDDIAKNDRFGMMFDNRRFVYGTTLLSGYLSHYSLKWLFVTGDNDRHHAPSHGLLYLWELPFILAGLLSLWKRKGRLSLLVFTWLVIAPLAASPTSETPHAIRTLVFLPVFQVLSAFGIVSVISWLRKIVPRWHWVPICLYTVLALGNIAFYFHMYYAHMNIEYSRFWQYGYKQAVEYAEAHKGSYKKVVVSIALEQPHMFFLFYTKYDPKAYLSAGGTSSGGFREVRNRFDRYEFRAIGPWDKELHDGSVLYVGTPKEIPSGAMYSVYYLNGQEAMRIGQ